MHDPPHLGALNLRLPTYGSYATIYHILRHQQTIALGFVNMGVSSRRMKRSCRVRFPIGVMYALGRGLVWAIVSRGLEHPSRDISWRITP